MAHILRKLFYKITTFSFLNPKLSQTAFKNTRTIMCVAKLKT